jgi:hypothetical protein
MNRNWMSTRMLRPDRAQRMPNTRRALLAAGVFTIGFSLVVSIAPAMAAKGGNGNSNESSSTENGNGNAGVAQIHDAVTDLVATEQGNEPWVCSFWVGFYAANPTESGSWQLQSWAPTGDGTVVASGTYDTDPDGVDETVDLSLAEGHYRLSWQTTGDNNSKQKTFWVACEASEPDSDPTAEPTPTPSDEPASTDEATPTDEAAPSGDPAPTDEAAPSGDPAPTDEAAPSDEETPGGEEQSQDQTPPTDESQPSDEAAPTDESTPTDQEDPDATDEAAPTPEEDVLAGNESPVAPPQAPEGDAAPAASGATELPDTALPVQPSGVLATIGVLLIIAAHVGTRRARSLPTA